MGPTTRTLRALMRIANSIEVGLEAAAQIGTYFPIWLLDRPWVEVPDAISAHLGGERPSRAGKGGVPTIEAPPLTALGGGLEEETRPARALDRGAGRGPRRGRGDRER